MIVLSRLLLLAFGLIIIAPSSLLGSANALSAAQINLYSSGVSYFDIQSAQSCTADGVSTATSGDDNVAIAYSRFIQRGFSNEQTAGILGNLAGESGFDPTNVQNSFTRATGIEDGEHDPTELFRITSSGNRLDAGYGIAQWTSISRKERFKALADTYELDDEGNRYGRLDVQLDLIWYELTGAPDVPGVTGGNYGFVYDALLATNTVEDAVIVWVSKYEVPGSYLNSADKSNAALIELYKDDRIKSAEDIYAQYAGEYSAGAGCSGTSPSGLINTVVAYAWPSIVSNNSIATTPAKEEYTAAIDAAKSNGEYTGGGNDYGGGIDCGGFITRVMRDSGFDTSYNTDVGGWGSLGGGNTVNQKAYLDANWEAIEVNSTSDLKPGDVAMKVYGETRESGAAGHTFMFIGGVEGFETNVASSALDSRAPASGPENPLNSSYIWYRYIDE